jgi:hypothetical protein
MRVAPGLERPLAEALGLGAPLIARAERERVPWIAASVVHGPAVVLGAAQRAGRVLRLDAGTAALRRATAGTAVYLGGRAVVWTLALPHVAALVPDATPRTLLNRNVRGFLAGLGRSGAIAHYFGREWISVRRRPAAVMGFQTTPGGAVLLEVFAGIDAPLALPEAIATEEERALDRWLGKPPASLGDLYAADPAAVAREVMRAVGLRAGAAMEEGDPVEPSPIARVDRDDDPMPDGFTRGPARRVPIGWIDTGVDRAHGRVWLGGDVLAPAWALANLAAGEPIGDAPIDGAAVADLEAAVREAK